MTDCFWCGFVDLRTNLEHLRCGQRSGPCKRRDGTQQRPAAGGPHGVLPGWRGGSASNPCAGAMQDIANGDGVRLKGNGVPHWCRPVAQTRNKRQGCGGSRRCRCRIGRCPGGPWAWSGGLAAAQAGWLFTLFCRLRDSGGPRCGRAWRRAGPLHVRCVGVCGWLRTDAAQRRQALRPIRATRPPGQAVQTLRYSGGRPLRSARTAGCSTARRVPSGCRSGPMRPWCRRPGAHGVRPRPGCGCRRWCGSAAASRMPGRCWPDR